jgi:hypothetical protein
MTIKVINLSKLLKLCSLVDSKLIGELRDDLRKERDKLLGKKKKGGGHFHYPWWDAAKGHALGLCDLTEQTKLLVEAGVGRDRLYPLLTSAFLEWLERLRRSTNLTLSWSEEQVHTHYVVPGMDLTVKVDNLLALRLGEDHHKLIYPYFCEHPVLSERWARVGLWLMRDALSKYDPVDMEILDVLRARSFSGGSVFLKGDERSVFIQRYEKILGIWSELRPEYGL